MIRHAAHPMLAAMFVAAGYGTLMDPERVAAKAEPVVDAVSRRVPGVPRDAVTAVRLNSAVQIVAGTLLSLGLMPRMSSAALAGTLVPTTAAGHPFWKIEDPQDRARQRIQFLKNLAMFGGLLLAATEPRRHHRGGVRAALARR
ncbi:putative oxidoreductase [Catenulispora sp. MAP12-49]|uniref:DoxX family protein n=1 Tax=Catenulispora sp. MAP12-49 TaxID=3156302 RepID=UPI0035128AE4